MRRGILATREELAGLKRRVDQRPFDSIYNALRNRCALILESSPVTEARWRTVWQQGGREIALQAARTAQGRIWDLIISDCIEPNSAYRSRAIEELRSLASWSTWLDPSHPRMDADLCTAEAAVGVVVALDWLWDELDEDFRQELIDALIGKAVEPYLQAVRKDVWWYTCYHSWNAVINGGMALVSLALADESEQAAEACDLARDGLAPFFDALQREGGWDEGLGYWGMSMRYTLLLAEAMRRLEDDQTIIHRRGLDQTGLFPVHFTPNGQPAGFGNRPSVPLYGTFYLLARYYRRKEVCWWLDTFAFQRDASTAGWSAAGLALLFRPEDQELVDDPDLSLVKVFKQIGWASMADSWPRPKMYVAIKAGDLSANHSERDMCSIQLQVDGEMLLIDLGSPAGTRELFPDQDTYYQVQARAHNTLIVAEADHHIDARGTVLDSHCTDTYRWIACSAGDACGENVTFHRHVVMFVDAKSDTGRSVLVLDKLDLVSPEKLEMFWHTHGEVHLAEDGVRGGIHGRRSEIAFAMASTMNLTAERESHEVNTHKTDRVIHVTGGAIGPSYVATVFSRKPIRGDLEIRPDIDGVTVVVGKEQLRFDADRMHLVFKGDRGDS